jgi:adenosylmethionine---8-amino-7-oxononanoate aminotransferase
MNDLIILGTDTDAGKTTFALLWLARFGDRYAYWKPVETGPSDSDSIAHLVPGVVVHAPHQRFVDPVAPPLAARRQGTRVDAPAAIIANRPAGRLLIETFGSPFSPLTDAELQLSWLRLLGTNRVLVGSKISSRASCVTSSSDPSLSRAITFRAVALPFSAAMN